MSIEEFRDLSIGIVALVLAAWLIINTFMSYALYRRLVVILDCVRATAANIGAISVYLKNEVVRPLAQVAAIVQGIKQGISMASKMANKQEGGKK